MNRNNYNLNGGEVTLDLPALKDVLGTAYTHLNDKLQDQLRKIKEEVSEAYVLGLKGELGSKDSQEQYRQLCHANTGRTYMLQTANDLSDAIEALFHVSEACRRETIKVWLPGENTTLNANRA